MSLKLALEKATEPVITFLVWKHSVIAVNGHEKVGLENTRLYQKVSRSSLT